MDPIYKNCPPLLSDGRLFTDWRTAVRREEHMKYINNIVRDDEYRLFLEKNAENIMDNTWDNLKREKSCWVNECVHNYPTRMHPTWFYEERKNYDSLYNPNRKTHYICSPKRDYRATITKGSLENY
jgi:hypothetical protein